ncbi:MAG: NAD(P)/FAD-dependent oxidoreductase [Peptococcaceae bacterium]
MNETDILIIGGGPAGMVAAIEAAELGADVVLAERDDRLGGQLIKQTHKFFGSKEQYAGSRGIDIAKILADRLKSNPQVNILKETTVLGIYEDGVITMEGQNKHLKIKPKRTILATGAAEKFLPFANNDLPGIYGAGAVQTLMNVYGVFPGKRILMVGAGNIGLIVSYQLMQSGVEVAAIIDAAPRIGGYSVHASKIRRAGVPILTSHTIRKAAGKEVVEGAVIAELDDNWQPISGTEKEIAVDVICLSVGLSPLSELCWQAGCNMKYVGELGGYVPVKNQFLETTVKGLYVCGDAGGVEEASAAMVEGRVAGIAAADSLGLGFNNVPALESALQELNQLRSGPAGAKILSGLRKCTAEGDLAC